MQSDENELIFNFRVTRGIQKSSSTAFYELEEYARKIRIFNSLLEKNHELKKFDINLTDIQIAVMEHLTECMSLKEENFDSDVAIFNDICSAYMGRIFILEEPKTFIPVRESQVLETLVLKDIPFRRFLEHQARVQVGERRKWTLHLCFWEREIFREKNLRCMNLHGDPAHPTKTILYKT